MDPLTVSLAFATIVQLIALYKQEHQGEEALDHRNFIEWLEYHRHDEIRNLLLKNTAAQAEVDKILRENHSALMARMEAISSDLATLISRTEGFEALANIMIPTARLSDQAVSILKQFVNSESRYFTRIRQLGGMPFYHLEYGGMIEVEDIRFVEDDLGQLVGLGLVDLDYTSGGEPVYRITRAALRFVASLGNDRHAEDTPSS